jgi:hypothetical protein
MPGPRVHIAPSPQYGQSPQGTKAARATSRRWQSTRTRHRITTPIPAPKAHDKTAPKSEPLRQYAKMPRCRLSTRWMPSPNAAGVLRDVYELANARSPTELGPYVERAKVPKAREQHEDEAAHQSRTT